MLIVDFDGVIVDALHECALITWYAQRPLVRNATGAQLLADIPQDFLDRFAQLRNYCRLLEHFGVSLESAASQITDQAGFDRAFAAIPQERVQAFLEGANRTRAWLRETQPDFWYAAHRVFPGLPELLSGYSGRTHVVTAKDADSTWAILRYYQLDGHVASVVAECSDKATAARTLCETAGVAVQDALFIDDNLPNVRAVAGVGVQVRWASWGWHTDEHERIARDSGIRALTLDEVDTLVPAKR